MLSFKPTFSLSSFTFIKRLFSSSSLSAIRVVSSAYLRLLIFLPAILIPACKKRKKAKWLSGEALQIAVKRREAKSQGEKERYKHLNAEFQRIARRDKKAFFSDQCKETDKNNRMGKTRDLFKKIRDTKGTFHTNMGTTKDNIV